MKALLSEFRVAVRLAFALPAIRHKAVAEGDRSISRHVWPGAAWDVASTLFWRGVFWPVYERLPSTRQARRAATGCPLCDAHRDS